MISAIKLILPLFQSIASRYLIMGIAAIIVAFFVWRNDVLADRVDNLRTENEQLEAELKVRAAIARANDEARKIAEDALKLFRERELANQAIRDRALRATTQDDGNVAPVLRQTIDSLLSRDAAP